MFHLMIINKVFMNLTTSFLRWSHQIRSDTFTKRTQKQFYIDLLKKFCNFNFC